MDKRKNSKLHFSSTPEEIVFQQSEAPSVIHQDIQQPRIQKHKKITDQNQIVNENLKELDLKIDIINEEEEVEEVEKKKKKRNHQLHVNIFERKRVF